MELDELFNKYGSDKERNGYTGVYHALLKNIKDHPMNILEIGIGTMIRGAPSSMDGYALPGYLPGGSLRAWRDYFPKAQIYGMDIQSDTQFTEERIETNLCDSTNSKQVSEFFSSHDNLAFNIIIDDGSHLDVHQLITLQNFYRHIKPGGYYIIEDVYPGSQLLGALKEEVQRVVGDNFIFTTETKNLVVISAR